MTDTIWPIKPKILHSGSVQKKFADPLCSIIQTYVSKDFKKFFGI